MKKRLVIIRNSSFISIISYGLALSFYMFLILGMSVETAEERTCLCMIRDKITTRQKDFFEGAVKTGFGNGTIRVPPLRFFTFSVRISKDWDLYLFTQEIETRENVEKCLKEVFSELKKESEDSLVIDNYHVYLIHRYPGPSTMDDEVFHRPGYSYADFVWNKDFL